MTRPRVLVVDDKSTFLSLFEKILGDKMEVRTAVSGPKALALLQLEQFDVVISDVRMPGMDGVQLLRLIKARAPHVEVILVTAFGEIPDAVRAIKEGAFSYLTKPFEPDEVIRVVEQALAGRRHPTPKESQPPNSPALTADASLLSELSYRQAVDTATERFTREYLMELLRASRGNVTRAARRAGIERESFHRLMKKHHLNADDFRTRH